MTIGYAWLIRHYKLPDMPLRRRSTVGTRLVTREVNGVVDQIWPAQYAVSEDLGSQLEFALKYDGVNLAVLSALFKTCVTDEEISALHAATPNGIYVRRIAFLYEWLTGRTVAALKPVAAGYEDALDDTKYIPAGAAHVVSVAKWRIRNNMPGTIGFCPLIERSQAINAAVDWRPNINLAALAQAPRVRLVAALIGPSLGASMKEDSGSIRTRI